MAQLIADSKKTRKNIAPYTDQRPTIGTEIEEMKNESDPQNKYLNRSRRTMNDLRNQIEYEQKRQEKKKNEKNLNDRRSVKFTSQIKQTNTRINPQES